MSATTETSTPTQADLKQKLCVFSHDGVNWSKPSVCRDFEPSHMYTDELMGEAYVSFDPVDSGAGSTRYHEYARPAFILAAGTHEMKWRILDNARTVMHLCTNTASFDADAPVRFKPLCRGVKDTAMSEPNLRALRGRRMYCRECEAKARALNLTVV